MMKREIILQKRYSTDRSGSEHPVWQVHIPKAMIGELGWCKGDVLTIRLIAGRLLLSLRKGGLA
jgi:hypothetical protein